MFSCRLLKLCLGYYLRGGLNEDKECLFTRMVIDMFGLSASFPSLCSIMEMLTNTTAGKKKKRTLFRQKAHSASSTKRNHHREYETVQSHYKLKGKFTFGPQLC